MKPVLVADIGLNHEGSVTTAKSMISMAKFHGVDYVKFQKRTVEKCYSQERLNGPCAGEWGTTVRDLKNHLEFGEAEYDEIDAHCRNLGIPWFASPRLPEDVEFLMRYDLPFLKIAGGSLPCKSLLEAIKDSRIPVIMSTGMATLREVHDAVSFFGRQLAYILHCVSIYPAKAEVLNLKTMRYLGQLYGEERIGFSSHARKTIHLFQAYCMGARMLEFHITMDRSLGGDHIASQGAGGIQWLVQHIREAEPAWGEGGWPGPLPEELAKGKDYPWRSS